VSFPREELYRQGFVGWGVIVRLIAEATKTLNNAGILGRLTVINTMFMLG
jgi:hypothetical protein